MAERSLSTDLRKVLINNEPFSYCHLIKFERAVTTTTAKPARNARDYSYITDASYDIAWDDGSKNVKEQSNGSQTYRANRVSKVGTIAETVEAKASTMTLEISSESLSSKTDSGENVTITYSGTNAGDTVTLAITYTDWAELGFLEGDKITISWIMEKHEDDPIFMAIIEFLNGGKLSFSIDTLYVKYPKEMDLKTSLERNYQLRLRQRL